MSGPGFSSSLAPRESFDQYLLKNARTDPVVWEFMNLRHKAHFILEAHRNLHAPGVCNSAACQEEVNKKLNTLQLALLKKVQEQLKKIPPIEKPPALKVPDFSGDAVSLVYHNFGRRVDVGPTEKKLFVALDSQGVCYAYSADQVSLSCFLLATKVKGLVISLRE